jgi:hypothetical protein
MWRASRRVGLPRRRRDGKGAWDPEGIEAVQVAAGRQYGRRTQQVATRCGAHVCAVEGAHEGRRLMILHGRVTSRFEFDSALQRAPRGVVVGLLAGKAHMPGAIAPAPAASIMLRGRLSQPMSGLAMACSSIGHAPRRRACLPMHVQARLGISVSPRSSASMRSEGCHDA